MVWTTQQAVLEQMAMCARFGAAYAPSAEDMKAGVALNVRGGKSPINGLRHPPHGDATGWFIWAGPELSTDPEFFKPLHIHHLSEWLPGIVKYLGLPPGWRFLVADGYEDVWFDAALLNVDDG